MARRFEKSGGLLFCYGSSQAPATEKRESKGHRILGILLALGVLVTGMLIFAPHALGWPAVSHTVKAFVNAVW